MTGYNLSVLIILGVGRQVYKSKAPHIFEVGLLYHRQTVDGFNCSNGFILHWIHIATALLTATAEFISQKRTG